MPRRSCRLSLSRCEDRLTPAGWLDAAWGDAGIATPGISPDDSYRNVIAFLPDGGAVVGRGDAARSTADGTFLGRSPAAVTKLLPDGRPDAAFGVDGTATLPAGGLTVVAVAPGPDGTVYVLGNRLPTSPEGSYFYSGEVWPGDAELIRLTATGELDTTFDGDGVAEIGAESDFRNPTGLAVRADGRAVVSSGADPTLALIGTDGGFDPAAGDLVRIPIPAGLTFGQWSFTPSSTYVGFTPEGGMLAVVEAYTAYQPDAWTNQVTVVSKLTAAGTLDTSYGTDGQVLLSDPRQVYAVQPTADGGATVLVSQAGMPPGGWCGTRSPDIPTGVARLDPTGQMDAAFAGDGTAELNIGWGSRFLGELVPLPDGRTAVLAVGDWSFGGGSQLQVRVIGADGQPDPAVADGGWLAIPLSSWFNAWWSRTATAVAADGRVAILGSDYNYSTQAPTTQVAVLDFDAETPPGGIFVDPPVTPMPGGGLTIITVPPQPVPPSEWTLLPVPVVHINYETGEVIDDPTAVPTPEPDADPLPNWHDAGLQQTGQGAGRTAAERVVTAGPTVGLVAADGSPVLPAFAPFEASYTGTLNAVRVDIDGDGSAELVVSPDDGGGPVVAVYRADGTEVGRFWGIEDPDFRGGVRLAAGDVNDDGTADLVVTAGNGGGPRVAVFDGKTLGAAARRLVGDFFAFEEGQRGGAFADGALVFGAGPGGGPRVRGVDARGLLAAGVKTLDELPEAARRFDRFVGDPADRGGLTLDVRPAAAGGVELTAAVGDAPSQVLAPLDGSVSPGAAVDPVTLERVFVG